jgi:hypothetical protein
MAGSSKKMKNPKKLIVAAARLHPRRRLST